MAIQPLTAQVVGIPHIPSIRQVNVRDGAGTSSNLIFKTDVGTSNLAVIEVVEDVDKRNLNGKTYQWFHLQFPQNQTGWIRDDLIEVIGDGLNFGYPTVTAWTLGFNLTRMAVLEHGAEITPTSTAEIPAVEIPDDVTVPEATPKADNPESVSAGPASAICMGKTGVNMRRGPGTNNSAITRMQFRDTADIIGNANAQDGKDFLWVKINLKGTEGWVREDFLRYTGDFGTIGLSSGDKYSCPVPDAWWIRDFDSNGQRIGVVHHGWDHAGDKGFTIMAGPKGGKVMQVSFCQRCGTAGTSTVEKGFSLGDSRIFRDQGWNFGYGHFIIVRYTNDLLPQSTKEELARRGFEGGHLFVMYAHLQDMLVQAGQDVSANAPIATLGNSGNSSGPHLHLEVRASKDPNETRWARMVGGLMTPAVLFNR